MKKFFQSFTALVLVCCLFNVNVFATNVARPVYDSNNYSASIDDEVIAQFKIPLNSDSQIQTYVANPDYIVFTMTRKTIYWQLVGFSSVDNWLFSGYINVVDLTSGLYEDQHMEMIGTSGSVGYSGYQGHAYAFTFHGTLYFTAHGTMEKNEECSGGSQWTVPAQ